MGIMNAALQKLDNVKAYRGYAVNGGGVWVSQDDFIKHLDDTYGEVVLCNLNVKPGAILKKTHPEQFEEMRQDYEIELQNDLLAQVKGGNDVDIDYHD